jgi:hypothetical protein
MKKLVFLAVVCVIAALAQKQDEQSIKNAIDAYRKMWQAMTPDQRKTLVEAGGGTPERYEQTIRMQQSIGSAPKATGGVRETQADRTDIRDTVRTSTEDRHAIRDANLIRLKEESCPAEVALEVAALRSTFAPAAMPPARALLAVADTWFQRTEVSPALNKQGNIQVELERLLGECKTK